MPNDPGRPYSRNPWRFSNCSVQSFKKTLKDKLQDQATFCYCQALKKLKPYMTVEVEVRYDNCL
ncbi:hypothetical protein CHS0354_007817 [Potamilus streckersoni]|uniref:Uncharacterized protein n=1 Tax=Potamilus streckersoni TaxID=2493646 RepID=A0AAE0RRA6_9BIVA|nr:hypothetical protein CHS0354_007817 [Potamilus streckersoni]